MDVPHLALQAPFGQRGVRSVPSRSAFLVIILVHIVIGVDEPGQVGGDAQAAQVAHVARLGPDEVIIVLRGLVQYPVGRGLHGGAVLNAGVHAQSQVGIAQCLVVTLHLEQHLGTHAIAEVQAETARSGNVVLHQVGQHLVAAILQDAVVHLRQCQLRLLLAHVGIVHIGYAAQLAGRGFVILPGKHIDQQIMIPGTQHAGLCHDLAAFGIIAGGFGSLGDDHVHIVDVAVQVFVQTVRGGQVGPVHRLVIHDQRIQ